jgi:hypothetical protein
MSSRPVAGRRDAPRDSISIMSRRNLAATLRPGLGRPLSTKHPQAVLNLVHALCFGRDSAACAESLILPTDIPGLLVPSSRSGGIGPPSSRTATQRDWRFAVWMMMRR